MVEEGLVGLITTGLNDTTIQGGFAVMLPKDFITATNPKAWTYRSLISEPLYTLDGQDGLTSWEVAIDCHGFTMKDAITLARAIDGVLRGSWAGVLPDEDATVVQGVFRLPGCVDGFADSNRSFVRTLEYRVVYEQA